MSRHPNMSGHEIRCRKTGKALAMKIGGGHCVCPEGQCSEESYQNPNAAQATDFFTPGDKPPLAPASRSPTKGVNIILAPFTDAQVANLDAYQQSWRFHPFTCPNRGDGKHGTHAVDLGTLVPTTSVYGWICPYCDYTQNWAHAFMVEPVQPNPVHITPAMIKHMVDRFLWWKLPANFSPDAGITFKAEYNEHTAHPMKHEPTGTNLFDATQAYEMVQHMVSGGLPPPDIHRDGVPR